MTGAEAHTRRLLSSTSAALVVTVLLLFGGCGGEGTDADDVVADYIDAIGVGDGAAACALVSPTDPSADYQRKCEPADLGALAISGVDVRGGGAALTYTVGFSGERATVRVGAAEGETLANVMTVVEDGEWWIVGDARKLDQRTLRLIEPIEDAMEVFARSRPEGYTGVTLEDLTEIDPKLARAVLTVGETSPYVYVLTLRSATGHSFSIVRDSDGVKGYSCDPKGFGRCPKSGYWQDPYFPPDFDPDKATAQDYPSGFDPDE